MSIQDNKFTSRHFVIKNYNFILKNQVDEMGDKIRKCVTLENLNFLLKTDGKKFSEFHWQIFFNKMDLLFNLYFKFLQNTQDCILLNILKNICLMKVCLKVRDISKIFFVYGMILERRRIFEKKSLNSLELESYILNSLEKNIYLLDSLDYFRIGNGLKNSLATDQLDKFALDLFLKINNESFIHKESLIKIICAFNYLSYDYGLRLWWRINFQQLKKDQLIELLISSKNILLKCFDYIEGFDFSQVINQLKLSNLTDYEFSKCFEVASEFDYTDEDWNKKANDIIQKEDAPIDIKESLESSLLKQQSLGLVSI